MQHSFCKCPPTNRIASGGCPWHVLSMDGSTISKVHAPTPRCALIDLLSSCRLRFFSLVLPLWSGIPLHGLCSLKVQRLLYIYNILWRCGIIKYYILTHWSKRKFLFRSPKDDNSYNSFYGLWLAGYAFYPFVQLAFEELSWVINSWLLPALPLSLRSKPKGQKEDAYGSAKCHLQLTPLLRNFFEVTFSVNGLCRRSSHHGRGILHISVRNSVQLPISDATNTSAPIGLNLWMPFGRVLKFGPSLRLAWYRAGLDKLP